jgi:hypothetical protein
LQRLLELGEKGEKRGHQTGVQKCVQAAATLPSSLPYPPLLSSPGGRYDEACCNKERTRGGLRYKLGKEPGSAVDEVRARTCSLPVRCHSPAREAEPMDTWEESRVSCQENRVSRGPRVKRAAGQESRVSY